MAENEFEIAGADGPKEEYLGGATRSSAEGRGRPSLIGGVALWRLAQWLEKGVQAGHAPYNWEKGMLLSRCTDSIFRHWLLLVDGQTGEDHAAAILFNTMVYVHTLEQVQRGRLPKELVDLPVRHWLDGFVESTKTTPETMTRGERPIDLGPGVEEFCKTQSGKIAGVEAKTIHVKPGPKFRSWPNNS